MLNGLMIPLQPQWSLSTPVAVVVGHQMFNLGRMEKMGRPGPRSFSLHIFRSSDHLRQQRFRLL